MHGQEICMTVYEVAAEETTIWLDPNNISIYFNEARTITAVISPPLYENKEVLWQSSNPQVVQIVPTGEVDNFNNPKINIMALSPGFAEITATMVATNQSATAQVEVILNPVQSVTIEPDQLTLAPADTMMLRATVRPVEGTNPMVTFESTTPGVASVNEIGLVVAKQPGETRIIARSMQDDSVSDFIMVTVSAEGALTEDIEDDTEQETVPEIEPADEQEDTALSAETGSEDGPDGLLIGLIAAAVIIVASVIYFISKRKPAMATTGSSLVNSRMIASGAAIPSGAGIRGIMGQFSGQAFGLRDGQLIIGRDSAMANVVYPDTNSKVSRKHLTITYDHNTHKFVLVDSSSNGTFLKNGQQLEAGKPYHLNPGEQFYLVEPQELFELKLS